MDNLVPWWWFIRPLLLIVIAVAKILRFGASAVLAVITWVLLGVCITLNYIIKLCEEIMEE